MHVPNHKSPIALHIAYRISFSFSSFYFLNFPFLIDEKPSTMVAVTIDQFPQNFLEKFRPYFGKGGFNALLERGAVFTNAQYQHAFNETGPGHSAIYSGCYGNRNGIVMNNWYDKSLAKRVNCVEDLSVKNFYSSRDGRSPKNNIAYTVSDMLRLSNNFQSKVIGISVKDRAQFFLRENSEIMHTDG